MLLFSVNVKMKLYKQPFICITVDNKIVYCDKIATMVRYISGTNISDWLVQLLTGTLLPKKQLIETIYQTQL